MSGEFRLPWEPSPTSERLADQLDVAIVAPEQLTFHRPRGAKTACGLAIHRWSMEKLSVALRIGRPACLRCWPSGEPFSQIH